MTSNLAGHYVLCVGPTCPKPRCCVTLQDFEQAAVAMEEGWLGRDSCPAYLLACTWRVLILAWWPVAIAL